jgi:hypothetical protein
MLVKFKHFLKSCSITSKLYFQLKDIVKGTKPSFFYNQSRKSDTACFVLAGYKDFLWDVVFERLKHFALEHIDICIVSSGLFSERLLNICKNNGWSYLCTKRNCVTLALNIAIERFPAAQSIYKLDEDIFITKNFFRKLIECYEYAEKESEYIPAFVAPLIPISAYGHMRILKKLSLEEEYARRFQKPMYAIGMQRMIESSPEAAKFFWDEIPQIDELDALFVKQDFAFSVSPIRFSIGAILMKRETWDVMGHFNVSKKGTDMGHDEIQICSLAMTDARSIIVSENTAVGHLSFSRQNDAMKEFFLSHPKRFQIKEPQ